MSHGVMPPKRTMPPRRASMRSSTSQGARGTSAVSPSSVPTTRKRQQLVLEAVSPARVFPMLDDMVAGVVLTYLPSEELGTSALINKAWQASNSNESLWRPFLATVDPISTLGKARLAELASKFSCKQVVTELSLRLCSLCREPTSGFFTLTCSRVCQSCFETDARVKMCSLSFAKNHYLLSNSQATTLPKLYADKAKETGVQFIKDAGIMLTTCSAGKASAVARWGSEEAFEEEMSARKAKPEASYKTRVQAFNAAKADDNDGGTSTSASTSPPAEGSTSHSKSINTHPNRPRILGLKDQTNYVGLNQQEYHSVRGEKYGFFRVVNDAFFDAGPTIVIGRNTTGGRWDALVEALNNAQEGTTIKISDRITVDANIVVSRAVRLVGSPTGRLVMNADGGSLVLNAPSIVRSLTVNRMEYDLDLECSEEDWLGADMPHVAPAVHVVGDVLLDGCTFDRCPLGQAVALQLGRLVARANTFQASVVGLAVFPSSRDRETTVHLEGNIFKECYCWGLLKGPDRCHPQDNDSVLNANRFWNNGDGDIRDYQGD